MRHIFVIFALYVLAPRVHAQTGFTITYDHLHFYVYDSSGNPLLTGQQNKFRSKLVINKHESYEYPSLISDRQIPEPGKTLGKTFQPHTLYKDTVRRITVSQFGKGYRMIEDWTAYAWEITHEKKSVAGFECIKAVSGSGNDSLIAWYCEKLPAGFGPQKHGGLPGTILETTDHKENYIFRMTATRVEPVTKPVTEPKKGKLVTREEWQRIRQDL